MSRRLILSAPARGDLAQILDYIRDNSSEERAMHVASRIRKTLASIAETPGLGHRREDLTSSDVRFLNVWSYLIIYRADSRHVEVVRIVHASRDIETLLRDGLP